MSRVNYISVSFKRYSDTEEEVGKSDNKFIKEERAAIYAVATIPIPGPGAKGKYIVRDPLKPIKEKQYRAIKSSVRK